MATKHGLGRGLGAMISDGTGAPAAATPPPTSTGLPAPTGLPKPLPVKPVTGGITKIPIQKITKNPFQPRQVFPEEAMVELTDSIKKRGVLQPLLVRAVGDGFELIAGERRFRASSAAGLTEVPVIVMEASDNDSLEVAIIENVQRENLNILEEAEAYELLANRFNLTQEQVAARVGKARATVTNIMRVMSLPTEVKQFIASGQLSAGHSKLLSGLSKATDQILYANRTIKENLSVRSLEKLIQKDRSVPRKPRATKDDIPTNHLAHLTDKLHRHFGTSVKLSPCKTLANGKKVRGVLEIEYYSSDDLTRILDLVGISDI